MERIVRDWVFWVYLYLAVAISVVLVLVELQNIRSIQDRARLNAHQQWIQERLERIEGKLR